MADSQDSLLLESERPRVVTEPRIQTPSLVILLGSTPALAGLELMRNMLSLQERDLRRVALVYIDTDNLPNDVVDFQRRFKGKFHEFALRIAVPTGISSADRQWQEGDDPNATPEEQKEGDKTSNPPKYPWEQHSFIAFKEPQYFATGAGGIRNNGHIAACFNEHSIYRVINNALSRITQIGGDQDEARVHEVQANLVAFLGGGTGSGIITDIAIMLRDLFASLHYKQRINLMCILPEAIKGVNDSDLKWRRSNATASLLEMVAYSQAARIDPRGHYEKYVRSSVYNLTNDPIANEVFVTGHTGLGDAISTARIIGIDLFQRITDASGAGFLEHSKYVDRRVLAESDDRGLPMMFSTTCPLEVRFPAEETAQAFAQISAARLLPLIASYRPRVTTPNDADRRTWLREWRAVARFDANVNDPMAVKLPEFQRSDFEKANQSKLDILWSRVERYQRTLDTQIKGIIDAKFQEERRNITESPRQDGDVGVLHNRIQYLQRLQQEYIMALDDLRERDVPPVRTRPVAEENRLTDPNPLGRMFSSRAVGATFAAYNATLTSYAAASRYKLLEDCLKKLLESIQSALDSALDWFRNAEVETRAKRLESTGLSSMAWQGRLDFPHPHHRHVFDLHTLRTQDGHNIAIEHLYRWATGGDNALEDEGNLDYSTFLADCIKYISSASGSGARQGLPLQDRLEFNNPRRLPERVVSFFHDRYKKLFQDTNMFELLEKAAPPSQTGEGRPQQTSNYLLEHLQSMRGLIASLVTFEAEIWREGQALLDTSLYLGMHWRSGDQKEILDVTLARLGSLTERGDEPAINAAIDPHRLQIAYAQHGISISTIRDFYLDRNSAMEAYRYHQNEWTKTYGQGNMPVHSCGAVEKLVEMPDSQGRKLADRVIRRPSANFRLNSTAQGQIGANELANSNLP